MGRAAKVWGQGPSVDWSGLSDWWKNESLINQMFVAPVVNYAQTLDKAAKGQMGVPFSEDFTNQIIGPTAEFAGAVSLPNAAAKPTGALLSGLDAPAVAQTLGGVFKAGIAKAPPKPQVDELQQLLDELTGVKTQQLLDELTGVKPQTQKFNVPGKGLVDHAWNDAIKAWDEVSVPKPPAPTQSHVWNPDNQSWEAVPGAQQFSDEDLWSFPVAGQEELVEQPWPAVPFASQSEKASLTLSPEEWDALMDLPADDAVLSGLQQLGQKGLDIVELDQWLLNRSPSDSLQQFNYLSTMTSKQLEKFLPKASPEPLAAPAILPEKGVDAGYGTGYDALPELPWLHVMNRARFADPTAPIPLQASDEKLENLLAGGFSPQVLYRGTGYNSKSTTGPGGEPWTLPGFDKKVIEPGFFASDDPKIAWNYTNTQTPAILPVHMRMRKPYETDWDGAEYSNARLEREIREAMSANSDILIARNMQDVGGIQNQYIGLDPAGIRHVLAKFDPKKWHLTELLAALGGLGFMVEEEQP